jgi:hypothetical protein
MKPAAEIALVGAFAFVFPALTTLPKIPTIEAKQLIAPRQNFSKLRIQVKVLGVTTCLLSLIPPWFYFLLLRSTNGKTSEQILPANAHCSLLSLYASTAALLVCFGIFYFKHRKALDLHSKL